MANFPFASVIVPIFNDNEHLALCLNALCHQDYARDAYEIIVVDNNSDQDVSHVVSQFEGVRLMVEPRPGSYIARNRGIEAAQGEVIAFTDADCIPKSTWLRQGVEVLWRGQNVGLVAGRIELFAKNAQHPNPFELYETIALAFPQHQFIQNDHFGVTANLFTFRHVIEAVGPFDETLKSGGDKHWGQRVYAAGYQQLYAEKACVKHPARDTWEALRKRSVRIVGGRYDMLRASGLSNFDLIGNFISFLKPPFGFFLRTWRDERLSDLKQKCQFTVVMLRLRGVAIRERFRLQFRKGVSDRG
ncbi:MAG: glycosyltransferase [Cyanobacteria bacterium J06560_5]